jgi:hypothetical protein
MDPALWKLVTWLISSLVTVTKLQTKWPEFERRFKNVTHITSEGRLV